MGSWMVDGWRRGIVHACCGGLLRSIRSMGWDGTAIWHEKEARRGRNVGHVPGFRRHSHTDGGETFRVERMTAEASQFDGTWHGQKADGDGNGRRKTSVRCAYELANDHGESRHNAAPIELWSGGGGGSGVRLFVNRSDACCMRTRHRSRQGHFSDLAQNSGSSSRAQDNFTA